MENEKSEVRRSENKFSQFVDDAFQDFQQRKQDEASVLRR